MKTISIDQLNDITSTTGKGFAATVGFFDGVHRGHRFLIEQLKQLAERYHLPSLIITFPMHPRRVLPSRYQPLLLNSFEEKLYRLSTTEVDYCHMLDFTSELSDLSAKDFIQHILHRNLHIHHLLVGYDHRFGKGRVDGFEQYKAYGHICGMSVEKAIPLLVDDIPVSSSLIRKLIQKGDVKKAKELLSYHYVIEGTVVKGNQIGRSIGFPTANIELSEKNSLLPANGVYATTVHMDHRSYQSMSYIGKRSSLFSNGDNRLEVHILDFDENIYDKKLNLEFIDYIRDEITFESIDDLKIQLELDRMKANIQNS